MRGPDRLHAVVRAEQPVQPRDAGAGRGGADAELCGDLVAVQTLGEQRQEPGEVRGDVGGVRWDGDAERVREGFGVEA